MLLCKHPSRFYPSNLEINIILNDMRGILILFKIVNRKLKYMVEIKIEYYTIKHIDGMFANISANDIESKEEGIEILNHDKFPGKWEIFNYDYDDSNEISFYIFHKLKEIVQSKFRQVVTNLHLKTMRNWNAS